MPDFEQMRKQIASSVDQLHVIRMENMALRLLVNAILDSHPHPEILAVSLGRTHELFVSNALPSALADEDRERLAGHLCDVIEVVSERRSSDQGAPQ